MEKPEDPCPRVGAIVEPSCRVKYKTVAVKYGDGAREGPVTLPQYVRVPFSLSCTPKCT
jgi:hypothetical protein